MFYYGKMSSLLKELREPQDTGRRRGGGRSWVEIDGKTMQVDATCPCGRGLYFRYGVTSRRELVVEDVALRGPAVLRCMGCGEAVDHCLCVVSQPRPETRWSETARR